MRLFSVALLLIIAVHVRETTTTEDTNTDDSGDYYYPGGYEDDEVADETRSTEGDDYYVEYAGRSEESDEMFDFEDETDSEVQGYNEGDMWDGPAVFYDNDGDGVPDQMTPEQYKDREASNLAEWFPHLLAVQDEINKYRTVSENGTIEAPIDTYLNEHYRQINRKAKKVKKNQKKKKENSKKKKKGGKNNNDNIKEDRDDPPKQHHQNVDKINLDKGAISAFQQGLIPFTSQSPNNCKRGWHADSKTCANTCRVRYIAGNPLKNLTPETEQQFLKANQQWAKCEACLVWSRLSHPRSHTYVRKSMIQLKGGSPSYCQSETPECQAKEKDFAACMGPDVCSDDCWSINGSQAKCMDCFKKYCDAPDPEERNRRKAFYTLCYAFPRCYKKFNPNRYAKSNDKQKLLGQGCWGKPIEAASQNAALQGPFAGLTDSEICERVSGPKKMPYPDWKEFYVKCKDWRCINTPTQHDFYNEQSCHDTRCVKTCLNTAEFGGDCIECKYGITYGGLDGTTKCGDSNSPGNCYSALKKLHCVKNCNRYAKYRIIDPHGTNHTKYKKKCASYTCNFFGGLCNECTNQCAKQGDRTYTSALGENKFRDNYVNWGCEILCKAKNIHAIATGVYALGTSSGRSADDPESALVDYLDDKSINHLNDMFMINSGVVDQFTAMRMKAESKKRESAKKASGAVNGIFKSADDDSDDDNGSENGESFMMPGFGFK